MALDRPSPTLTVTNGVKGQRHVKFGTSNTIEEPEP